MRLIIPDAVMWISSQSQSCGMSYQNHPGCSHPRSMSDPALPRGSARARAPRSVCSERRAFRSTVAPLRQSRFMSGIVPSPGQIHVRNRSESRADSCQESFRVTGRFMSGIVYSPLGYCGGLAACAAHAPDADKAAAAIVGALPCTRTDEC